MIYFIPGSTVEPTYQDIVAAGLGHAFDKTTPFTYAPLVDGSGPGGRGGRLVTRDSKVKYEPDQQTWQQMTGLECWMGWSGEKPKPEDLERKEKKAPAFVEKKYCGELWKLPQVRYFEMGETSPEATSLFEFKSTFDGTNFVAGEVVDRYKEAERLTAHVRDLMVGKTEASESDYKSTMHLATDILALNYHVAGWEVAAMDAMNFTHDHHDVIETLVDWQTYLELKKKLDSNSEDLKPGEPAS